jgi:hypothetical protein
MGYAKFQDSYLFSKQESVDAVVVLGDKKSRKTTKIQHFQLKNRDDSIYFELKDIYSGFQDVKSRIKSLALKNDGSYLYLLFDSIDECRLQGPYQTHIIEFKIIFMSREADREKDTDNNLIK